MREPRRGRRGEAAAPAPPPPVVLERGPWWTGRRLRPQSRPPASARLPLWARVGAASPVRLEVALTVLAVLAAAVGGGVLLAAVLAPGRAG